MYYKNQAEKAVKCSSKLTRKFERVPGPYEVALNGVVALTKAKQGQVSVQTPSSASSLVQGHWFGGQGPETVGEELCGT